MATSHCRGKRVDTSIWWSCRDNRYDCTATSYFLLPNLLKVLPSRRFWITAFTLSIIIGLSLLCFTNVTPIVSSICLGVGAGGLVSLTLLLPLDMASSLWKQVLGQQ